MTNRERVMRVLNHEPVDKIPFTVYDTKIEMCTAERDLRNRGMCVVKRTASYDIQYKTTRIKTMIEDLKEGKQSIRKIYETPIGCLTESFEQTTVSLWQKEHLFKKPEDYKILQYLAEDQVAIPCYARAKKLKTVLADDFIVRDQIPLEPLQELINHTMGAQTFCMEWMDHRDEIQRLYLAQKAFNETVYPIVADGPLDVVNYGGNVAISLIGTNAFQEFYIPLYNDCAEILHRKGKKVGVHFDGDNRLILKDINQSALDYVEAYDIGVNLSLTETQKQIPNKILWLNWPSAWHLNEPTVVFEKTKELLNAGINCQQLIVGITEDVPENRKYENYNQIMCAIEDVHVHSLMQK